MPAAFIEQRPKSTDTQKETSHYVIVVDHGEKHGEFKTQKAAHDKACAEGYCPVHTARVRLQDRDKPNHWRSGPMLITVQAGPLLDGSGNMVGMVSAKLDAIKMMLASQNVNFPIKAAMVATLIDATASPTAPARPT